MDGIDKLFESQVNINTMAVAVEYNGSAVTYSELNTMVDRISRKMARITSPHDLVAVYMESSIEYVATILGILRAGCAFLPLSIDMPWKHTELVVTNSKVAIIVTKKNLTVDVTPFENDVNIQLCEQLIEEEGTSEEILARTSSGRDMAYVIYTSGSTGTPHGCMVSHEGVCNLVRYNKEEFNLGQGVKMLQYASISFDASIFEIFSALLTGCTLVLAKRHEILPGEPLVDFVIQKKINIMLLPPSSLALLNKDAHRLQSLTTLLVGGEKCPVNVPDIWISETRSVYNAYGPTEGTVYATIYKCQRMEGKDIIPIGKPLPGCVVQLLDDNGAVAVDGEIGEICIGGLCIGNGYWRNPSSTEARFKTCNDQTLFCTRDLARKRQDGQLEYIGRKDNQVKVRGYRVEPEAVENTLSQSNDVAACVVVARSDIVAEQCVLVAFILPRNNVDHGSLILQLKRLARTKLPSYMNPTFYEIVDEFPMMSNGSKVDRKALLSYQVALCSKSSQVSFRNDVEKEVTSIFEEVLNINVTPSDNFFDLGGTSLLAAAVARKVEKTLGVQIPVALLFSKPTAKSLADSIQNTKDNNTYASPFAEKVDYIAEATLDPSIIFPERAGSEILECVSSANVQSRNIQIFLTGATGFLGGQLLADILESTEQTHVYCMVRADSEEYGKERIIKQLKHLKVWKDSFIGRFSPVLGSLGPKYLGMDSTHFEELASKIDIIYHIAADTNYVKPYSALKEVNVTGTHEMLRFAGAGNKYKVFHYCSSMCVYGPAYHCMGLETISESTDFTLAKDHIIYENGYVRSKWIADYMVHTAIHRGLNAMLYRPGFIQASSEFGVPNETDFLSRIFKGCIQMGCYPDLPYKFWMPVPLDYVSKSILQISLFKIHEANSRIFHLVASRDNEPSMVEMFEMLATAGYPLQKVSIQCWHEELERILDEDKYDNALHPVATFILEKVYAGRNTILELHYRTPSCTSENTDRLLKGTGVKCPRLDQKLIEFFVNELVQSKREKL